MKNVINFWSEKEKERLLEINKQSKTQKEASIKFCKEFNKRNPTAAAQKLATMVRSQETNEPRASLKISKTLIPAKGFRLEISCKKVTLEDGKLIVEY